MTQDEIVRYYKKGTTCYNNGQYDKAIKYFSLLIRNTKKNKHSPYYHYKALCYFRLGNMKKAFSFANKIPTHSSLLRTAYLIYAIVHFQQKNYEEAAAWLDKVIKTNSSDTKGKSNHFYWMGKVHFAEHNLVDAIFNYTKAIKIKMKAYGNDVELAGQQYTNKKDLANCFKSRMRAYYDRAKFDEALSDAKVYLTLDPCGDSHYWLGRIYTDQGFLANAAWHFMQAINLCGDEHLLLADILLINAQISWKLRSIDYAKRNAEKFLEVNEKLSRANFAEAIELNSQQSSALYLLARYYLENLNVDMAIKNLELAIKLNRTESKYYVYLARANALLSRFDEAATCFSTALTLKSKAKYYHERGQCYKELGETKKAWEDFKRAREWGLFGKSNRNYLGDEALTLSYPVY